MDFRCELSTAFLAGVIGALKDVLAPFAPEGRAEVPAIGCMTIESRTLDKHNGSFRKKISGSHCREPSSPYGAIRSRGEAACVHGFFSRSNCLLNSVNGLATPTMRLIHRLVVSLPPPWLG